MLDPDRLAAALAVNLRDHRTRQGLSLEQLAKRADVSKGMLVQIEGGKTNPSIATLCRVANALTIPVARLLELAETPPVRIVRKADVPRLWHTPEGSEARLLMSTDGQEYTELWEWVLAPGEAFDGDAHPAGAREILSVRAGRLTLTVGEEMPEIDAGDTLLFRADRPHRYANRGPDPVCFTMVVVERSNGGR